MLLQHNLWIILKGIEVDKQAGIKPIMPSYGEMIPKPNQAIPDVQSELGFDQLEKKKPRRL
jgi:hypothetical protein